jgi:prepilin peptidase CpaA
MVLSGLIYSTWVGGWDGLGDGLLGMLVGLATLLPLYAVGGMGAGDVKLMAGMGAWLGAAVTWNAFVVSVIVGGVMALAMVLWRRSWKKHYGNFLMILLEFLTVKSPQQLSQIAAERKPQMLLLPYGIPICIGSIAYFLYAGMI